MSENQKNGSTKPSNNKDPDTQKTIGKEICDVNLITLTPAQMYASEVELAKSEEDIQKKSSQYSNLLLDEYKKKIKMIESMNADKCYLEAENKAESTHNSAINKCESTISVIDNALSMIESFLSKTEMFCKRSGIPLKRAMELDDQYISTVDGIEQLSVLMSLAKDEFSLLDKI